MGRLAFGEYLGIHPPIDLFVQCFHDYCFPFKMHDNLTRCFTKRLWGAR